MKPAYILILAMLITAAGCSKEDLKRIGYESAQSYGQHQCLKDPSADCSERESYNSYDRRKEMRDAEP